MPAAKRPPINMTEGQKDLIHIATLANLRALKYALSEIYAVVFEKTPLHAELHLQDLAAKEFNKILAGLEKGEKGFHAL